MEKDEKISKHYNLFKKYSENDLSESWQAINLKTEEKCFLKHASKFSSLGYENTKSILSKAYSLQKQLQSSYVLSPTRKLKENNSLYIEYPFLDYSIWKPVTKSFFWASFPKILINCCEIIDYIHSMGLVHGDVRIEQFLYKQTNNDFELILTDFDFVKIANEKLEAKVFGTPGHIAPEILENDLVTSKSDNYSLGISLGKYLDKEKSKVSSDSINQLNTLISKLTNLDPLIRPDSAINALFEIGLIDEVQYQDSLKSVLSMQLISSAKNNFKGNGRGNLTFKKLLVDKNRVFGIHDDLMIDFDLLYECNKSLLVKIFKILILKSNVNRHGEFWHIETSDEVLFEILVIFSTEKYTGFSKPLIINKKELLDGKKLFSIVDTLKNGNKFLKAFLYLKYQVEVNLILNLNNNSQLTINILQELGNLSMALNRINEALGYFERVLDLSDGKKEIDLELIRNLSYLYLKTGDYRNSLKITQNGIDESIKTNDKCCWIFFKSREAWIQIVKGNYKDSKETLIKLIDLAKEYNYEVELTKLYIVLSSWHWTQGDFVSAEEYLNKCLTIVKNSKEKHDRISLYSNLSFISFNLANYKDSIKFGKEAISETTSLIDKPRLTTVHENIFISLIRLGDYSKAKYWLSELLAYGSATNKKTSFRDFYSNKGCYEFNSGDLKEALNSVKIAESICISLEDSKYIGYLSQNYSLIYLYCGNYKKCINSINKSKITFQKYNDVSSLSEIEFLEEANNAYYSSKVLDGDILVIFKKLLENNCRFYTMLCLLYILITAKDSIVSDALDICEETIEVYRKSQVPVFKAVNLLIKARSYSSESSISIQFIKMAFTVLNESGQKFWAMLICQNIAQIYIEQSQEKLAKRFLLQALKITQSLGNSYFTNVISKNINSLEIVSLSDSNTVKVIHQLSEIIVNIDDYDSSLHNLVQYAVNETGAERGVILLNYNMDIANLQIKASVNCDDLSLKDIRDFSRNIPFDTVSDFKPLFINDATRDKRTKAYKSVIAHNILSVICIPIKAKENIIGVLYLDHHTITALFEPDDFLILKALANFISVVLSAANDYRVIHSVKDRLAMEAKMSGKPNYPITQNSVMYEMLDKIPRIASSNMNVLVYGESGTGKEILTQMLHDNNPGRKNKPFVKVNCAAISASLAESELFGVAKETATGVAKRQGKFMAADGGTLFLDEIGDMPLDIQSKILRVIEYQEFEKVGSNKTETIDTRFIFATNKDLKELIEEKKFREDLYYRICTMKINLPPLRERLDDIPLLIEYFTRLHTPNKSEAPKYSSDAINALMNYSWPGNIRELKYLVERFCFLNPGKEIKLLDLPIEIQKSFVGKVEKSNAFSSIEKTQILKLLIEHKWNQSQVSRTLNIPLSTLRRKIKKYNISKAN